MILDHNFLTDQEYEDQVLPLLVEFCLDYPQHLPEQRGFHSLVCYWVGLEMIEAGADLLFVW